MHRMVGLGLMAALALLVVAVVPVAAAVRTPAHMEVQTNFDPADDPFTSNIAGCASGTVATGDNTTQFVRMHGVFAGDKFFDCGDGSGFVVRLNAIFGYDGGSVGTWSIVGSWGSIAGLQGSGKLVGTSTGPDSIVDVYDGTMN
jgi:hypothetical protein